MTYLNDVEEGGETAFPAADNATYNERVNISNKFIIIIGGGGRSLLSFVNKRINHSEFLGLCF